MSLYRIGIYLLVDFFRTELSIKLFFCQIIILLEKAYFKKSGFFKIITSYIVLFGTINTIYLQDLVDRFKVFDIIIIEILLLFVLLYDLYKTLQEDKEAPQHGVAINDNDIQMGYVIENL
jgi:hypothetical protein